ncbi:MAG TPA: RecX family transcriptional regulator [Candidatus Saccharimonadales bacterium]|nr:RecX family transcriptional regulator [Candidatus Saccharimonadales bacterium]
MKVTDIKQQIRRADRYSIYVDKKYTFSLSESELLATGLRVNQEVTADELTNLKDKAVIDKGYDRALNLIMRRPRSEWELRDYLKRKEHGEAAILQILNKLSERGYVNDEDFARRWVENRRLLKSTSKRRLVQELRQKRVADEIIDAVLAADETDELEVLRGLISRKRAQTRYKDDMKLMQYLLRQGYGYGDIKEAMKTEE